jgi:hypothetical protein
MVALKHFAPENPHSVEENRVGDFFVNKAKTSRVNRLSAQQPRQPIVSVRGTSSDYSIDIYQCWSMSTRFYRFGSSSIELLSNWMEGADRFHVVHMRR